MAMRDFKGVTSDRRIDLTGKSIVRYQTHGRRFEMLVDPEKAWLFLQGEEIDPDDIFEAYQVYENISRGVRSPQDDLDLVFGELEERAIATKILSEGNLQLTEEQRREIFKEKREEIVDFIATHCINPRDNVPIPKDRLEKAILDLGVNIKYKEDVRTQAMDIIKALKPVMPIRFESVILAIKVPATYTGPVYGLFHNYGQIEAEEWQSDGSLVIKLQLPSGLQADFLEELTSKTKGKSQVKVLERLSE